MLLVTKEGMCHLLPLNLDNLKGQEKFFMPIFYVSTF